MDYQELQLLKLELGIKAKKDSDFIISASIVWFIIAYIWSTQLEVQDKGVVTFIVGILMLPMALIFSKLLRTNWKILNNPLQPLGLWLYFSQLFYFPFLVFVLLKHPEYFVMTYAVITGAHLFPYAWFYDDNKYAIIAGIISSSSLIIGLNVPFAFMFCIPLFTAATLLSMFFLLWVSIPQTNRKWEEMSVTTVK